VVELLTKITSYFYKKGYYQLAGWIKKHAMLQFIVVCYETTISLSDTSGLFFEIIQPRSSIFTQDKISPGHMMQMMNVIML